MVRTGDTEDLTAMTAMKEKNGRFGRPFFSNAPFFLMPLLLLDPGLEAVGLLG